MGSDGILKYKNIFESKIGIIMSKWTQKLKDEKLRVKKCISESPKKGAYKTYKTLDPEEYAEDAESDTGPESFPLDLLNQDQAQYYKDLVDIMVNNKNPALRLTPEEAEKRAAEIVAKSVTPLQIQQSAEEYKLKGYIKIYSTQLETSFYLVKDEPTAAKVPDLNLPVITQQDLEAVSDRTISNEVRLVMLYTKLLLGGSIRVEDCNSEEWEKRRKQKKNKKYKRKD